MVPAVIFVDIQKQISSVVIITGSGTVLINDSPWLSWKKQTQYNLNVRFLHHAKTFLISIPQLVNNNAKKNQQSITDDGCFAVYSNVN